MTRSLFLIFAFLFFVSTSSCGYSTKSALPSRLRTIHVEHFKNNVQYTEGQGRGIYLPLLEVDVRNAIINRFLFDGNLKPVDSESASLILKGELKNYQRDVLRLSDNDDVEEYRITVTVSLKMLDTGKEEPMWEGRLSRGHAARSASPAMRRWRSSASCTACATGRSSLTTKTASITPR